MNWPSILTITIFFGMFPAGTLHAGDSVRPGRLDTDPPTLVGAGFQWWLTGDDNDNARLTVDYRRVGTDGWKPAPKPLYWPGKAVSGYHGYEAFVARHFAGSMIDLREDTAYEVRLTLSDPDGVEGEAGRTFRIRTRRVPAPSADGREIEVFADGSGPSLESALPDLQRGDTVLLHAGTYTPPPFRAPPSPQHTGGEKAVPGDGEVRHVYPPDWEGEKQEPSYVGLNHAYHGGTWDADFNFQTPEGVRPGDTIIVHAGEYRASRFQYHQPHGLWPTGEYILTRKGTAEQPITIKAAGDGPVVFDGNGVYRLFDLRVADHHILDGIDICNAFIGFHVGEPEKDMQAQGAVIQNCSIEKVRAGVVGGENARLRVLDTRIEEGAFPNRREGTYVVAADGTQDKPITLKPFGDGPVVIDGGDNFTLFDTMAADHLIFQDLDFRNTFITINAGGRFGQIGATGLTVRRCDFRDVQNGIFGFEGSCRNFTILDNVMVGRLFEDNNPGGYAVNLAGAGHAVAHNHTEAFWDHLNVLTSSIPEPGHRSWSMDFYNNICLYARDNTFEVDGAMWNVRFSRNLIGYSGSFAFSSQPTLVGPTYYIRNIGYRAGGLKFLRGGGVHAFHNTIIDRGGSGGFARHAVNNVFMKEALEGGKRRSNGKLVKAISTRSGWTHNAHRVGAEGPAPGSFSHNRQEFDTFAAYAEEGQPGAVEVDFDDLVNVPKPTWERGIDFEPPIPLTEMDFRPAEDSPLADAALVIRGINDDYAGEGPDIGALERGRPVPHYGPRESGTANDGLAPRAPIADHELRHRAGRHDEFQRESTTVTPEENMLRTSVWLECDFGDRGAYRPFGGGELPEGWVDRSGWADARVSYEFRREGDHGYLHAAGEGEDKVQLACPLDVRLDELTALRVCFRARSASGAGLLLGVRRWDRPERHNDFYAACVQGIEKDWKDYDVPVRGEAADGKIGFYLNFAVPGSLDLSELRVERILLDEYTPPTVVPTKRGGAIAETHRRMCREAAEREPSVIFYGDSITAGWSHRGKEVWDEHIAPLDAMNLGIGGDRVEHVLWRVQDSGLGRDFRPRLIVLLIGVNNLFRIHSVVDIAEGMEKLVRTIRDRTPDSRLLILGVFPSGEGPDIGRRDFTRQLNRRYAYLADGERVFFFDFGEQFLDADGYLREGVTVDGAHPGPKGYRIWARNVVPKTKEILNPGK